MHSFNGQFNTWALQMQIYDPDSINKNRMKSTVIFTFVSPVPTYVKHADAHVKKD